jgi:hypothetical protein
MGERISRGCYRCVTSAGDAAYDEVLVLQERLHDQRAADEIPDTLLLLEHSRFIRLGVLLIGVHCVVFPTRPLAGRHRARGTSRGAIVDVPRSRAARRLFHRPPRRGRAEGGSNSCDRAGRDAIRMRPSSASKPDAISRNRGVWVGKRQAGRARHPRLAPGVDGTGRAERQHALDDYRGIVACGLRDAG